MSTAYHHQTDGQTEVVNKYLKCFLRYMTGARPKEWVQWLPLAEYWYNINKHPSTNVTPFEVVYRKTPPLHVPYVVGESVVKVVDKTLQARETAIEMLKFHLERAQDSMQVTIRQEQHHKFPAKYYGPFMILAKVGSVAYKLELPSTSQIHLVFHVSQPKLCKGSTNKMRILPHYEVDGLLAIKQEAILDRRMAKLNNKAVVYVLVKCVCDFSVINGPLDSTVEAIRIRAKWENDDYICRGHILNGMSDSLFDVYTNVESTKELWDSLESKYMTEDYSSKNSLLDFKHTLKHGKDDLPLVQLGSHLRIEESLRAKDSDKGNGKEFAGPSVNMTEEGKNKNNKQNKGKKRDFKEHGSERGLRTIPKTKVDAIAWWIDYDATTHVCKDRCWFKTYEPVEDGFILYVGDDHFTPVYGKGSVVLEFSSGKSITLFNVLYVLKLHKNLISGHVLNKCGYKQVYESDKYILSKCGVSVGFGYYNNGMFMLNLNKVPYDSDSVYMSSSTVVNFSLWHARLGHVHYKRMLKFSKDELIHDIDENPDKCTTCLSKGFWGESMLTACYLLNRVLNKRNKTTPYELWYKKRPKLSFFRVWGCRAVVRLLDSKRKTLGEKDESHRDDQSDDVPSEIPEPRKEAIDDEIGSIMENNTWVLSDLPPGCKPLEIDYFDTYAPIARITTIRLLLALTAIHNLVIHQMDVKTTFLNGDLEEEVYIKQPEGFVMLGNEHTVCKLVKSLYGLKQAPKQWHQKFDEVVLSSGFLLNQSDKCVYSKFDSSGKGVIICLYVDDMLIFGTDQNQVDKTKKFLSSRFFMKDMGEADVILGIKIKRKKKRIVITQPHYIEKIIKKFNREDSSPVSNLMDPVEKLKPNTGKPVDQLEYSRAIGCLISLDASWINHVEDSSSTSGWVFLLRGGAISLASKTQTCITGSTMEYEFVALVAAGKEAEWLRNLIHEIPIWPKPMAPISIDVIVLPQWLGNIVRYIMGSLDT
nr:zinc finger, CCHC-type [Tanacetum cinerariifolium]